jgi:hypothetical protein
MMEINEFFTKAQEKAEKELISTYKALENEENPEKRDKLRQKVRGLVREESLYYRLSGKPGHYDYMFDGILWDIV